MGVRSQLNARRFCWSDALVAMQALQTTTHRPGGGAPTGRSLELIGVRSRLFLMFRGAQGLLVCFLDLFCLEAEHLS